MVKHSYNHSSQEIGAGGLPIQGQPGLQNESLSQRYAVVSPFLVAQPLIQHPEGKSSLLYTVNWKGGMFKHQGLDSGDTIGLLSVETMM